MTPKAASKVRHSWHLPTPCSWSKEDTFPPSSASAGSQQPKLQRRKAKQTAWDAGRNVPGAAISHPIASPSFALAQTRLPLPCYILPAIPPRPQPPAAPDGEGMRGGQDALVGHLEVPTGLSPSLLPTAHAPPPLPLPFSACCMKGASDLNLSARIRVRSRSPLPSTEPHQGCEAASAMAGYSRGGSARAAAIAGQRGTRG